MNNWDTTRRLWLKEIRKREPTWDVESRSGRDYAYISVKANGYRYEIYPRMHELYGSFNVYPVTQKKRYFAAKGEILGQLLTHIRRWSKAPKDSVVAGPPPKKLKCSDAVWDWRAGDSEQLEALEKALKPFGIVVTADPACEGSDTFGYLFSSRPLTEDELEEWRDRQ